MLEIQTYIPVAMSDSIHRILSEFRDAILTSVARLEFQFRDTVPTPTTEPNVLDNLKPLTERITALEATLGKVLEHQVTLVEQEAVKTELLSFEQTTQSRNILLSSVHNALVSSVHNTPALAAAVAAANPPAFALSEDEDSISSIEQEECDEEGVIEDEPLRQIVLDGIVYYIDEENLLYHETEDGYEQIGTYDPTKATIELLITEEEEEEEEEVEEE